MRYEKKIKINHQKINHLTLKLCLIITLIFCILINGVTNKLIKKEDFLT